MRTLWNALAILLLLHALALAGAAGWLYQSHRLTRDRFQAIKNILKATPQEEKELAEKKAQEEKEKQDQQADMARLLALSQSGGTMQERLVAQQQMQAILQQTVQRLTRDKQDLLRQMKLVQETVDRQQTEIHAQKKALEAQAKLDTGAKEQFKQVDQQDFQAALQMYEQLKAKQVKEMFQELMRQQRTDQAVDYLASMSPRKAAAILKEFKLPEEIPQATELVQRLRRRGVDLLINQATAPAMPSASSASTASSSAAAADAGRTP